MLALYPDDSRYSEFMIICISFNRWRLSANKRQILFVDSLETSRLRVHGKCKQKMTDKVARQYQKTLHAARWQCPQDQLDKYHVNPTIYISSAEARPVLCVRKVKMILELTPPSCSALSEHPTYPCLLPI